MQIHYTLTKNAVHLSIDSEYRTIKYTDKNFSLVIQLIKEGRLDEIPEALKEPEPVKIEEYIVGSGFTLVNGGLVDSDGNVLPEVLNTRLGEHKEDGFPVQSLVNFWNNLKDNPSFQSRNQLYKFLEQNGHPITEDGHFVAYRGVTNDFKDNYTETYDNSPGSILEMPRGEVDDDRTVTCSYGFHVAAWDYAKNFAQRTVEVKVNPRDVVAVPTDYNGQKMRVCRFEVVKECDSPHKRADEASIASWDGWEDDAEDNDEEYENQKCYVLEEAVYHKDRYKDRLMLATRLEEALHDDEILWDNPLSSTDILIILNENESLWNPTNP